MMFMATAAAADGQVSEFAKHVGTPLAVALIGLATALAGAALSFALGRLSDTSARRREGYAQATRELVAWCEYPYRIRRRTSDSPEELGRLAERGHDHQEALRYRETWIAAENKWVAGVFREVRGDLAVVLGPSCNEAWASPPVTTAGDMTLGSWGPKGVEAHIARFENAVEFRFGWKRLLAAVGIRPGAKPRPPQPPSRE
jgi:hypothetical protein